MRAHRLMVRLGFTNKMVKWGSTGFGLTPLGHAAMRGDVPLCSLLIEAGAKTNTRNAFGFTPLDLARWWLSGSRVGDVPDALVQVLQPTAGDASKGWKV